MVKYHKLYGVNMKAIYDLIHKLKEFHTDFSTLDDWVSLSIISTHNVIPCLVCVYLQKKQLFADLGELSDGIQNVLMNHLIVVNISSTSGVAQIEERVK